MEQDKKIKIAAYVSQRAADIITQRCAQEFRSNSEFIEQAILFYAGYLSSCDSGEFLTAAVTDSVKGIVSQSEERIRKVLFKQAVELATVENILAAVSGYAAEDVAKLRKTVVKQVCSLKGSYDFEEAAKYQNGAREAIKMKDENRYE